MRSEGRTPCSNHKEELVNLDAHRKKANEKTEKDTGLLMKANEIYLGI